MTPYMKKWTCKDFQQAGDMGLFEGCMAILIRGVILEHGQISPRKACAMVLASDAIRAVFRVNWVVRTQMPLSVFFDTDPVPNLCLIRGYPRD